MLIHKFFVLQPNLLIRFFRISSISSFYFFGFTTFLVSNPPTIFNLTSFIFTLSPFLFYLLFGPNFELCFHYFFFKLSSLIHTFYLVYASIFVVLSISLTTAETETQRTSIVIFSNVYSTFFLSNVLQVYLLILYKCTQRRFYCHCLSFRFHNL